MTTAIPRKPVTAQDYQERIVRALIYIQHHLDGDLPLAEVAAVAAFSPFHFHRIFRGLAGESLGEHLRRLRLERAAGKLKRAAEPVTQIAFEAGFETHEAFTRAFGQMFGMSPSQFRTAHKPSPQSACGAHLDDVSGYHPPDHGDLPPIEVKDLPSARVVFLRHVGSYGEVGATRGKLMMWAGMRGLLGPSMKMIGICYDDPDVTPSDKVRYDAAVVVSRPVDPEGPFGVQELAGGRYATATHRGPYSGLGATYQKIFGGWLPGSGYQVRDIPAFEQYVNSPQDTRPEDLITLIHIPLDS
jgi:AraC family transcriptional regulator